MESLSTADHAGQQLAPKETLKTKTVTAPSNGKL
jgi:hypothetical protein